MAIKKKNMLFAAKWMDVGVIEVGKISKARKDQ